MLLKNKVMKLQLFCVIVQNFRIVQKFCNNCEKNSFRAYDCIVFQNIHDGLSGLNFLHFCQKILLHFFLKTRTIPSLEMP